jgi:Response regulator containing a CheY-like receiver domain and an HTH DNA-binding domain
MPHSTIDVSLSTSNAAACEFSRTTDVTLLHILIADGTRRLTQQAGELLFDGFCDGLLVDGKRRCSVEVAHTALETLQKLHEQARELLVLDLGIADRRGLELLRIVHATHPYTRILVACSFEHSSLESARFILRAGAHGYIDECELAAPELLDAAQTILSGRPYISDSLCKRIDALVDSLRSEGRSPAMTPTERQLFGKMLMGCSLSMLASDLGLTEQAIHAWRAQVMARFGDVLV